jgi:hypothetical protein
MTKTATIPSRNDMFDAAHLKLGTARAIIDAVTMLDVSGNTDSMRAGSLTACLMHAEELLDDARKVFIDAQAREAA